jgi:hypothetical protein
MTAADLLGGLRAAVRETVDADAGGIWREDPVALEEFVTSPAHLGLPPLYPVQADAMVSLFGDDPKLVFADPYELDEKLRRAYQAAVCVWGKGAGKDYLCSIVVCWLVHILLCLRDPQGYLELAPGEAVDIVNVAYNAEQAKRVFFAKVKARIDRWAWLAARFNVTEGGRRKGTWKPGRPTVVINDEFIEFPNRIRAWSRHAQNESYEGLNIIAWVMDEASAFLSKLKRENAEAIYQTLRTSAVSRFGSRWAGFILSYPRHADDFTMTKLKEARARPDRGILADGPRMTWEVNLRTRNEPRVKVRHLEVPLSLVNDFESDFEEALSRYCCEPPMAREAFFRYPEHLRSAVNPGRAPLIEWERTLISRTDGSGESRPYVGVHLTRLRELPPGVKLYGHGDPGLVHDSFALAIAHAVPATVVRHVPASEVMTPAQLAKWVRDGHELDELVEWEIDVVRTVVDALIVWRPDPKLGYQVDLQNVEEVIFELKQAYPSLGHWPRRIRGESERRPTFTFDHWNSALTIQRMKSRRMNVKDEHWAQDFQVGIYRNARASFYNGLVTLPDMPSISSQDPSDPGALYELERIEFVDAVKVDHPEGGSKDSADAVVRVIQHATEHNRAAFAFGGTHGHKSLFDTHGPLVPSATSRVDPNRTPGITEAQRQAERLNRVERPLGELDPATGTANGRRLVFGSVHGRGHGQERGPRQELTP